MKGCTGDAREPRGGRLQTAGIFLLLLLSADAMYILVHLLRGFLPLENADLYALERDRGYAETFQYVKIFWIVLMLGVLRFRTGQFVYASWMGLFAYMLCDDSLEIHERFGSRLAGRWNLAEAFGLRAVDFGELVVFGILGLTFGVLIGVAYFLSNREAARASRDLIFLSALIVFFAVVVDLLHVISGEGVVGLVLGVFEEGGEMVAFTLVCWYLLDLLERRGVARPNFRPVRWIAVERPELAAAVLSRTDN